MAYVPVQNCWTLNWSAAEVVVQMVYGLQETKHLFNAHAAHSSIILRSSPANCVEHLYFHKTSQVDWIHSSYVQNHQVPC